jgi:DNA-binding NtrC family response regulator
VIEHVAVLAEPGQQIRPEDIPSNDDSPREKIGHEGYPTAILNDGFHNAKEQLVAYFEKEYISRLVARAEGNMSRAARLANVDRTTLYRLMEKHSFRRDELLHAVRTNEL